MNWVDFVSDNVRRQSITWTNDDLLLIWPLETNFSEIRIEIHKNAFENVVCEMAAMLSSGRWVNPVDPWASYQICKITGCACAGNAGNVFPRRRCHRKPLVSDPGMHHGTCVTHVPWCMSGSLTCGDGENVPSIPDACAPAILRIWQEAHAVTRTDTISFINQFWVF